MVRHLSVEPEDNAGTLSLRNIFRPATDLQLCSSQIKTKQERQRYHKIWKFSRFYGLRGTKYDIIPENTILYIEDVGEKAACH